MNPFFNALDQGYSEDEILGYLSKAIPKISEPIRKASRMGYNTKQILGYLSKVMNPNQRELRGKSESEIHGLNAKEDQERVRRGISIAAAAASAPIAASAASNALSRALPSNLKNLSAQIVGMNVPNASSSIPESPLDAANPNMNMQQQSQLKNQQSTSTQQPSLDLDNANIQQTTNIQKPEIKTNIADVLWGNLEKGSGKSFGFESDAFLKIARRMKSAGEITSREDFERFFQLFDQKKAEGKDLPAALREASKEFDVEKLSPKGEKISTPEGDSAKIEARPLEKTAIVSTPQGVGEIKEVRNGQALVEVDGKLHKVKEEEIETSPLPEKDLSELYDDLLRGIEKETGEDVSRMVQWAGYNPETNTLQFLPHNGALYTYDNISEEDAALLTDILSTRKSTGANFIGAWKKDSKSPIGAALSKLIRKLQTERGGKGNEYLAKHEQIYSAYEPAIEAKKRKKSKKR